MTGHPLALRHATRYTAANAHGNVHRVLNLAGVLPIRTGQRPRPALP